MQSLLFSRNDALNMTRALGDRLRACKTKPTAEEVEEAMSDFCAEVVGQLTRWVGIGKYAAFAEGCLLYWIDESWPQLTPLHGQYSSFHEFALQETGEEYSTYRGKIGLFETFFLNRTKDPTVAEYGPAAFLEVPIGKLQKAAGAVNKRRMTEEKWQALMDPQVHDRQFHHIMKAESDEQIQQEQVAFSKDGGPPSRTISMEDGAILYWPGGGNVGLRLGTLDVQSRDPTVREQVDAIIEALGIRRQ